MTLQPWMLVCDLDGTLLGHDTSLRDFEKWSRNAHNVRIAYATGRNLPSVLECLATTALPVPDFLITNIGTEIWEMPTAKPIFQWPLLLGKKWNITRIMHYMKTLPDTELQPPEFQTPWKLSYYAHDFSPEKLQQITEELNAYDVDFEIIYSGGRFLDFLPPNSHKGAAVQALATHLHLSKDRIIVAGDSGNDTPMFKQGYHNIVVANAQAELRSQVFPKTYWAQQAFAAGVLEGLVHLGAVQADVIRAQ